ncbi:MAG: PKD domain-containing protein [Acidobacteria bacterium]|nr:PKD domain-containing protein [Acidobacteriota bacterium]
MQSIGGFNSQVTLDVLGLPPNYEVIGTNFVPKIVTPLPNSTVTSTFNLVTSNQTAVGPFGNLIIKAQAGSVIHNSPPFSVLVNPNNLPDYAVSVSPSSSSVTQGGKSVYEIIIKSINGFSDSVTLDVLNLPNGYVAGETIISPKIVNLIANNSSYATLTIATGNQTEIGSSNNLIIKAVSGLTQKFSSPFGMSVGRASAAPVASFTFSPSSPAAGKSVQFNDTSSGVNVVYEWDFDNNGVVDSNEKNPIFTYNSPGPYTVTLRAKNSYGDSIKTQIVRVNSTSSLPIVTSVSKQYGNIALKDSTVLNSFKVSVNWNGTPGNS